MPRGSPWPEFASSFWRWVVVLLLFLVLQRVEPERGVGASSTAPTNKLVCDPDLPDEVLLLLSSGHQGDGQCGRRRRLLSAGAGERGYKAADLGLLGLSTLFFVLSMVAGRNDGGDPLLLGSEVDPSDPCLPRPVASFFKPSVEYCCWYFSMGAERVGSHGVASPVMWSSLIYARRAVGTKIASFSIQAMESFFPSEALHMCSNLEPSVVRQELLHMRKGIFCPFPCFSADLEAATQGMSSTYYVGHGLIVLLGKSSESDHRPTGSVDLKWDTLVCVNWWNQVDKIVHAQRSTICGSAIGTLKLADAHFWDAFSGSTPFYVEFIFRSIMVGATSTHERLFSWTCLSLSHDRHDEDAVSTLFGLCHRRWTTTPLLLILRFNGVDTLSLSSVKVISYLQLNSIPRVHIPDRPSGEPPAGHQLERISIEALEDCGCGNFESELSTDERMPYGSICDLQHLLREKSYCYVVQLGTYLSCSTYESHVMMYPGL